MPTIVQSTRRRAPEIPAGMTYEEFLDWHDEDIRAEWVDGQVILMSPASREHQSIVKFITNLLTLFVEDRDAGEVIPGPFQMKLPVRPSGREPDVIFVARERCDLLHNTFLDGPADIVVEVVSKESRGRDTLDKREEYEESGVREYWLIDPERREFTLFRRKGRRFTERRFSRGRVESSVLSGLWLDMDWLWRKPPGLHALAAIFRAEAT